MEKIIYPSEFFNIEDTLTCGQIFRFTTFERGFMVFSLNKCAYVYQDIDNTIIETVDGDGEYFRRFFDLDRDYSKIYFDAMNRKEEILVKSAKIGKGIRILNQDPIETLFSFMISQNNNIPRIKGIIDRLCETFGDGETGQKTFPSAEKLSTLTVEDLAPLRSGFRAKYILDAAKKVADGTVDLKAIQENPIGFGREELQKINGVGAKVAECTMLYGFHKIEAFPVDVWVRRIMAEMYPDGLPECTKGTEGIAQQYLFHYRRMQDK
jgi:N-glycosylase/DNA lyase